MKKLPVVEVEWIDSVSHGRWNSRESYIETALVLHCKTAGYLLKSDRQKIIIIQSQDSDKGVTDSITIPRSCVTSIRKLK